MAATRVQSGLNVIQTGTTNTVGSGQGWAAPTAGNLLIAVFNAAVTATTPAGWTAGPSVVNDNAAYLWWKIAAGTETTLTITQGGSFPSTLALFEYSGLLAAPTDVQNTSNAITSGTTTAAASITTTGPNGGDFVFAVAALLRDTTGTTMPTGLTWSNSYVAVANHASDGTHNVEEVSTWYATLQQSAAGATSTVATWTNAWNARTHLIIGFKLAAPPGATRVQSASNAITTGTTVSVAAAQGWATPTAGNLLVAWADSDSTVTGPAGFTAGPSVVDGNGAYIWYVISAGTESTITFSGIATGSPTAVGVLEYSGIANPPFDVQGSSTIAATQGSNTTAVSVTGTGTVGDLFVAAAMTHGFGASPAYPSSIVWTNSFVSRQTVSAGPTGGNVSIYAMIADFQNTSAATVSTAASWSGSTPGDRQELLIAFKIAAGAAAAQIPMLVMARTAT